MRPQATPRRAPAAGSRPILESLVAPLTRREFLATRWEKTFHHAEGAADRFAQLFALEDVDTWLASVRSGPADSVLLKAPPGCAFETVKGPPGVVDSNAVAQGLAAGCSLVLNHLEDWPSLIDFACGLRGELAARVGVNAYLTPPRAQTFAVHTDEHDVFVLQLAGEKVWHLHELALLQVHLPRRDHLRFPAGWGRKRVDTPKLAERKLTPGDVLYVPRGMPHCAVAQDDHSLHLTVSVTPLYWMDFLAVAVEQAAVEVEALRCALPAGFVEDDATTEAMRPAFSELLDALRDHASFDDVLAAVRRERVAAAGHAPAAHVARLRGLDTLAADRLLERRPGTLCMVERIGADGVQKAAIRYASGRLVGPLRLLDALRYVRDHRRLRPADLPGLDEASQLTLARRLVLGGLLQPVSISGAG